MSALTVPPERHAEIQQRVDAIRAELRSAPMATVDPAQLADDLQYLLNESRNLRWRISQLQDDLRGAA